MQERDLVDKNSMAKSLSKMNMRYGVESKSKLQGYKVHLN